MNRLLILLVFGFAAVATACGDDGDNEPAAAFQIDGTDAIMSGLIGPTTPDVVQSLIDDYPEVTTIVLVDVPGSIDDDSNLEAALQIQDAGLATHVPADGQIASGGVDFFLAGEPRTYDDGAEFGVHSWASEDGTEGADIPRDDPEHDLFLEYYDEIGIDEEFYWFTLEVAPAEEIHIMTEAELDRFSFATE